MSPAKPMNILNQSVMTELDIIVRRLESDPENCASSLLKAAKRAASSRGPM